MNWHDAIAQWQALSPQEKRRLRLQRVPSQVAQSMAFEREPVDLSVLKHLNRDWDANLEAVRSPQERLSRRKFAPSIAEHALRIATAIAAGGLVGTALDEFFILRLHRDLCAELGLAFAGRWRDRAVTVGGREPPPPHAVPIAMRDFALDLSERLKHVEDSPDRLLDALAFAEHRLLYIHPFVDYNGRVTRLFLAELLRRLDLPAVDLAPEQGEPSERYLAALRAADARDPAAAASHLAGTPCAWIGATMRRPIALKQTAQ